MSTSNSNDNILQFHSRALHDQAEAAGVSADVFGADVLMGREERMASLKGGGIQTDNVERAARAVLDVSEIVRAPKIRTVYRWSAVLGRVVADGQPDATGTP